MSSQKKYAKYCMIIQTFMKLFPSNELAEETIKVFGKNDKESSNKFELVESESEGIVLRSRDRENNLSISTIKRSILKAMKHMIDKSKDEFSIDYKLSHNLDFDEDDLSLEFISLMFDISSKGGSVHIEYNV